MQKYYCYHFINNHIQEETNVISMKIFMHMYTVYTGDKSILGPGAELGMATAPLVAFVAPLVVVVAVPMSPLTQLETDVP